MTPDALREALRTLPVEDAARLLLGAIIKTSEASAVIVETEAYSGETDAGSHAWRGRTPRTEPMYGDAGMSYIYFTYGAHWMFNVTCRPTGEAAAVLVRAAMPLDGMASIRNRRPQTMRDEDLMSGPGRLTAAMGINGAQNGMDLLTAGRPITIIPGPPVTSIWQGPRVGLAPHRGADTPWRFIDQTRAKWSSRPRPRGA